MARNKYIRDYRLLEYLDEKGRIKTDYEYIGDYYRFSQPKAAKKANRLVLAALAAAWAAFIMAIVPRSAAARTFYVILPFLFTAIPLWMGSELMLGVLRLPESFEHRVADRLDSRPRAVAWFMAALPAAALAGELVSFLAGGSVFSAGDISFSVGAAVLCAAGVFTGLMSGRFRTEKAQ